MKRSFLVLLLALGLVAGACSSSRSDDSSTQASSGGSSTTQPAPSAENTKFGDLESPCGSGDAKGATDVGVTDDSIQIAFGDDAGYQASPGVSHEASDAMKAFMQWCNDQGGINGRKVVGKYYDGKITDVVNAITNACNDKNFMLVGEAWALDSAQEQTRISCGLPAVPTYSVSADFAMAPLMRVGVPNPVDYIAAGFGANLTTLFPDAVKKVAMVYGNFSATQDTAEKVTIAALWPRRYPPYEPRAASVRPTVIVVFKDGDSDKLLLQDWVPPHQREVHGIFAIYTFDEPFDPFSATAMNGAPVPWTAPVWP